MSVEQVKLIDGYKYEIKFKNFTITTDAPTSLGGTSAAPDPHDYYEAALAGCTAMTVQMYAKRKSIPLDYADVKIKITSEGAVNEIRREIQFIGESLTEDHKQMLLNIADKCPIHKLISKGAKITTEVIKHG